MMQSGRLKIISSGIEPDKALALFREHMQRSESSLSKAVILAIVCVSIKLMGFEVSELSFSGLKVTIANSRYITGVFGWLMVWFFMDCVGEQLCAKGAKRYCRNLEKVTEMQGPNGIATSLIFGISTVSIVLIILITVVLAFAVAGPDMWYVVASAPKHFLGYEAFIGQWDTCVNSTPNTAK